MFPVIALFQPIDGGAGGSCYADACNGGQLVLEGNGVIAYVSGRRVGTLKSKEVFAHLATGGRAYFRLEHVSLGAPLSAVCTLL